MEAVSCEHDKDAKEKTSEMDVEALSLEEEPDKIKSENNVDAV